MAVVFSENFAGCTNGGAVTTANTSASAVGGTLLATNAWAAPGDTYSLDLSGGSSARYWQKSIAATNLLYLYGWIYYGSAPGVTSYPCNVLSGATIRANWRISGATCQMRNGTVAIGSASPSIFTNGTAYQYVWKLDVTGQKQQLRIYSAAGVLIWDSGDVTSALAGSIDTVQIGSATTAGPHYYMGRVAGDNQFDPASPTVVGALTGSAALSATVAKVYPGTDSIGLGWIGDSLTNQNGLGTGDTGKVEAAALGQGWQAAHVSVDGEVGRPIIGTVSGTSMQDVIDGWRNTGFNPYTVVLASMSNNLGATDAQWTSYLNTALAKVAEDGQAHKVYIIPPALRANVDDGTSPTGVVARFMAVCAAMTPPAGISLTTINYNALIRPYDGVSGLWQASDSTGRHMFDAGYDVRNAVLAPQIVAPGSSPSVPGDLTGAGSLAAGVIPGAVINGDMGVAPSYKGRLSAVPAPGITAALVGDGALSATVATAVTTTLPGAGALAAAVLERESTTGTFATTGVLSGTVGTTSSVTAPLAGSGALGAAVVAQMPAAGALASTGALGATVAVRYLVSAPLTGSAVLSTPALTATPGALAGLGTLTAATVARLAVDAHLESVGILSAIAHQPGRDITATADLGARRWDAALRRPRDATLSPRRWKART